MGAESVGRGRGIGALVGVTGVTGVIRVVRGACLVGETVATSTTGFCGDNGEDRLTNRLDLRE